MKFALILVLFVSVGTVRSNNCEERLRCFETKVNQLINNQIEVEFTGQYTYLYLSNVFLRDNLYYPKVAKYFRKKADEEMKHGERFIEYQNLRGGDFQIGQVQRSTGGSCRRVTSLKDGFSCAKELEINVTKSLTQLLKDISSVAPVVPIPGRTTCLDIRQKPLLLAQPILVTFVENGQNVTEHLVASSCVHGEFTEVVYVELAEMITHEFLGHQIEDTKELANIESTLIQIHNENSDGLGSFLVDRLFSL